MKLGLQIKAFRAEWFTGYKILEMAFGSQRPFQETLPEIVFKQRFPDDRRGTLRCKKIPDNCIISPFALYFRFITNITGYEDKNHCRFAFNYRVCLCFRRSIQGA